MTQTPSQFCPICKQAVRPSARYPHYICRECAARATDAQQRLLQFGNTSLSGGFCAKYADTDEDYHSHVCFIDGIKCWADEARFGGIVIQIAEPE